jgi:hypothetical protein
MHDPRKPDLSSVGNVYMRTCDLLRFFEIIQAFGQEIIFFISVALWPLPLHELAISWVWPIKISTLEHEVIAAVLTAEGKARRFLIGELRGSHSNDMITVFRVVAPYPQGPTIVGTGNGTPEVPELPSAWGYNWCTLSPGVINTER